MVSLKSYSPIEIIANDFILSELRLGKLSLQQHIMDCWNSGMFENLADVINSIIDIENKSLINYTIIIEDYISSHFIQTEFNKLNI